MLAAARTCTTVQGADDGRRTAYQPDSEPLPRINMLPGSIDTNLLGADVCMHTTLVNFEIVLSADDVPGTPDTQATQPALRHLADPIRAELHAKLFAAFPFAPCVVGLQQGNTERGDANDEDGIYREIVSYSVRFETSERDLSRPPA